MWHRLICLCSLLTLTACAGVAPVAPPAPTPMVYQPMLGRGLSFLARQYDADLGLLHASPAQPDVHWLAPDNLLARWVFQEANAKELTASLATTLSQHQIQGNGLVETIAGAALAWPPGAATEQELAPGIWLESQAGAAAQEDWTASADLTFFAALNAWNQGDPAAAHRLYGDAMQRFDGTGFRNAAFGGEYASRSLALAVIAGQRTGETIDPAVIDRLRTLQGADGGYFARYTAEQPTGTTDSESTAYALLALYALREQLKLEQD